jgi:uncharacterized membrane protein YkvA (DUF1232 family)
MRPLALALVAMLVAYAALGAALALVGRRSAARELARLGPDLAVLIARLARDSRTPRGERLLLWALVAYLALPFDLVPDALPGVGLLDDALLVAFVLRRVGRRSGPDLIEALWPGSPRTLSVLFRVARIPSTG